MHVFKKLILFIHTYSTFLDNEAMHGVVFASRNTVGILGNTTFRGSLGPAIQVCDVELHNVILSDEDTCIILMLYMCSPLGASLHLVDT